MVIWQMNHMTFSYIYKNKACVLHDLSIWHHKVDIVLVTLYWHPSQQHHWQVQQTHDDNKS